MALNPMAISHNLEGYGCAIPADICVNVREGQKEQNAQLFWWLTMPSPFEVGDGVVSY